MKHLFISFLFITSLMNTILIPDSSMAQISPDSERWDVQMIKEARIWTNLLVNYSYSDHKRHWPERKAALQKIVNNFPQSRWSDDAALIIACGMASFEDNIQGAIAELRKVNEKYPNGKTIITRWDPEIGCIFDETWLMWAGGLVFTNQDGTIKSTKPFGTNEELTHPEKEAITYFEHLESNPRPTSITTQLFISEMLNQEGDKAGAIAVLEKIVSNSAQYLPLINRADRIAASGPDGYYIRNQALRPEYRAYLSLIGYYERQGEVDRAVEKAELLIDLFSKDGWLWPMNEYIGDFFDRHGLNNQAMEQYQLALTGLSRYKEDMERRSELVDGSDIPDNFWEDRRRELERKLIEKP